jgi:5-methylcytosine-specific restriction endonuclease McrA
MSKSTRYYDSISEDRQAWAANFYCCMGCGGTGDFRGLQIHEICRKSHAVNKWAHPATYLLLCAVCHEGPFATAPHAFQLAVKYLRDREHYSLADWLRIEDPALRAPLRVTEQEVMGYVRILRNA